MLNENIEVTANPQFTEVVKQCLENPKMIKLYEYLTSNKIPGLVEGELEVESQEMFEFCQIVREIVWDSVYPNEPIAVSIN